LRRIRTLEFAESGGDDDCMYVPPPEIRLVKNELGGYT